MKNSTIVENNEWRRIQFLMKQIACEFYFA